MRKIYIGYDTREREAFDVAFSSITARAAHMPSITPLIKERLEVAGLLYRPTMFENGQYIDVISKAPMATQFAISRFLTPILAQNGWALFMDSDTVVMADIEYIFELTDDSKAVMVVKHRQTISEDFKMGGQVQTQYPRKNWSSVMLFNCDHPANRALTVQMINTLPGRDLHAFSWLRDEQIGELPADWNWLVGVQPKPFFPKIAHFTLGGPWLPKWLEREHDDIWLRERSKVQGMRFLPSSLG